MWLRRAVRAVRVLLRPHSWSRSFATQPEILGYLEATAETHGAEKAIRYGTEVLAGHWDSDTHFWHLSTTAGTWTARAVIVATGPWHRPRYPDIPGLDGFPGAVFHSADWDHGTDLTGRRIAVVGTGASTVQFLPEIQPQAAHIDVFQSTPQWVLPKPDHPHSPRLRRFLERRPAARRLLRRLQHWTQETIGVPLRYPRVLAPLEAVARLHLRAAVPDPALREALTPRYRLGGRRLIASSTYYPALTQPNVQLRPTRVTAVHGSQVIGADGTRTTADAIILATGFHVGDLALAPRLHGLHGTALARTWADDRRAYLGTSISGARTSSPARVRSRPSSRHNSATSPPPSTTCTPAGTPHWTSRRRLKRHTTTPSSTHSAAPCTTPPAAPATTSDSRA
ncbi:MULTISPECIES: NAD(P)/FAD-dependent oxidoreductase [unclassified Kitasatospora]|uniref:flavin-containing monooxygenase n=1 Tax=unclassified Kitasatospora TaxID=2633591 RepID=UPI0033D9A6FB